MNNLLKIYINSQGNAEVTLANIANVILAYDLSKKTPKQLNANYAYVYKVFTKLGLYDIKKNVSGKTKIPLNFVTKLLEELQKDPDKFNKNYVQVNSVNSENITKKQKYYSANYCYKLLEEIKNYEQLTIEANVNNNTNEFIKFLKKPSLSKFPKDIRADENLVEVIRNLSPKDHIIFRFLFPDYFNIFYIYLSNIFYENAENTMILEFDKIYYQFENLNDLKVEELEITKLINIANNKLKFYGWYNTKIRFNNNGEDHIKIIFTNQQQNNNLKFGNVISLNLKNEIINNSAEKSFCLVKKSLQDIPKNTFCNDFAEVMINNIFNQTYFNNKVIEFLKNNGLLEKFFNTENGEIYKEVIANLYNLQKIYDHLQGIEKLDETDDFLIDKIF